MTAQFKLQCSPEQSDALRRTLEAANAACNYIGGTAWESKTFRQFDLQKLCYREVRRRFGLGAQVTVRAISKVADAYKLDRNSKRTFRPHSAIAYDTRILRFEVDRQTVSLWSIGGRLDIPFQAGPKQLALLASQKGESDLIYRRGEWYLAATCIAKETPEQAATAFLGVDLGIANIASDSDGKRYSGSTVKSVRYRHRRLRSKLQKKQTRAAKRRLKKLAGKEARFARRVRAHREKEQAQPIDIPLRGVPARRQCGYQRCPHNCGQGGCKPAEGFGPA